MYVGGITYSINKSFGSLQLIPEAKGLRLCYTPVIDGQLAPDNLGYLDLVLPLDAVGGLCATARAFLYGVESLDENVILRGVGADGEQADTLIKLYRDKPKGPQGSLNGEEMTWLRLVTGRTEEERRRIKLGPRDLLCLELSCSMVTQLAAVGGTHQPVHISEVSREAAGAVG